MALPNKEVRDSVPEVLIQSEVGTAEGRLETMVEMEIPIFLLTFKFDKVHR